MMNKNAKLCHLDRRERPLLDFLRNSAHSNSKGGGRAFAGGCLIKKVNGNSSIERNKS